MAKASQDMKTGDISDARDSKDEEVEIRYITLTVTRSQRNRTLSQTSSS